MEKTINIIEKALNRMKLCEIIILSMYPARCPCACCYVSGLIGYQRSMVTDDVIKSFQNFGIWTTTFKRAH